jgi:DNA-binding protein HU-beta
MSESKEEKVNKAELVEEVANKTGLTRKASRETIDAMISVVTDALAREEKVTLVGFGTFQVREREARRGRNPQTGETIQIAAKKVPRFKPGKGLKEAVR